MTNLSRPCRFQFSVQDNFARYDLKYRSKWKYDWPKARRIQLVKSAKTCPTPRGCNLGTQIWGLTRISILDRQSKRIYLRYELWGIVRMR